MKPIIYESDYGKILSYILSDLDNDESKINQETFIKYAKHFNIVYKTATSPYNGLYKINNGYISSNTIDEIDKICTLSNNSEYCSELSQIAKHLPKELFKSSNIINIKSELPKIAVPYKPNNRDDILFVENMDLLQLSLVNISNILSTYQILDLYTLTVRMMIPKFMIDEICNVTDNYKLSKTVLCNDNKLGIYYHDNLNSYMDELNNKRIEYMGKIYKQTKSDIYLSSDVIYKVYITRTLNEWIDIFNELIPKYEIFNKLYRLLKNYQYIYNIITYRDIFRKD